MAAGKRAVGKRTARPGEWKIWLLYVVGFVPALWGFWLGATGGLGADPVKSFEHLLGLWALRFLMHAEYGGNQHGDGHCGGEHEDHHGWSLSWLPISILPLVSPITATPRIGFTHTIMCTRRWFNRF